MDPGADSPGAGEIPSSAAGAGGGDGDAPDPTAQIASPPPPPPQNQPPPSRYESQKRRDWNTFLQYLRGHKPPLSLGRCGGAHVIEFLKYLDQFGKTKVHAVGCPYYGQPTPPSPCACPLRQAWGSLDALIGRLRAAYEESGGRPESNPFAARPVRVYLREVRESQAKARGIPYEKKKRKRNYNPATATATTTDPVIGESSSAAAADAPVTVTEVGEGSGAKSSPPPPPPAEGSKPTS